MFNENIIREFEVTVTMSEMHRTINSKAKFNQRDNHTSVLIVNLLNNKVDKQPLDITNTHVVAKILKNDNTTSNINCIILDSRMGKIAIGFTEQALVCVGDNVLELMIQNNTQISYSPKIVYTVIDNLYDDTNEVISQNEYPVLNSLIADVQILSDSVKNLNDILVTNEEVRMKEVDTKLKEVDNKMTNINVLFENIQNENSKMLKIMNDIIDMVGGRHND